MKFVAAVVFAALIGCSHTVPHPKAAMASADECSQVYSRWLAIGAVSEYGADPTSKDEMTVGINMLDDAKQKDGTADRFFNACITSMNADQAACMMHANSFDELHRCAKMYSAK